MMTIPMEVKVPEKPAPMIPGISVSFRPAMIARMRETPMMERKGWIFHFAMATIMTMMAITNAMRRGIPVM